MSIEAYAVLLQAIRFELTGAPMSACEEIPDDRWQALLRLAQAHGVVHLVYDAAMKNRLPIPKEVAAHFRNGLLSAVGRSENFRYEYTRVAAAFQAAKIPFIPLKGLVLCRMYPEEWMRVGTDVDVLIRDDDLDRAAAVLTDTLGYRAGERYFHHLSLTAPSGVPLELHNELLSAEKFPKAAAVLARAWEDARPVDGSPYEYEMSEDMLYFYQMAHMMKHFANGGCGVRAVADVWVMRQNQTDPERENPLICEGGLKKFDAAARRLSQGWFDRGVWDEPPAMAEYILNGGSFGTMTHAAANRQVGKKGRYLLSEIVAPYDAMCRMYPALQKRPALLPVYHLYRWGKIVFGGGFLKYTRKFRDACAVTDEQVTEVAAMMRDLGLQPKNGEDTDGKATG